MEEHQEHAMEEVAQNFSEALTAAYRMSRQEDVASQQADPELTRRFCNVVISYFEARAAHIFAASQEQLAQIRDDQDPAELPTEPAQMPEQESVESVGAYMDFLNYMVAYYMEGDSMTAAYPWSEEAIERGLRASQE
jgi:hypothetical protein